ncbi:uncharacterized protein LOC118735015, partial [Rhagoletis pomonella]|uniref:uncharacterized protein LOC118735015 n=1 Tax=Rhagoletis pomonella TaxID=28610 RepID=UPI00177CB6FE
MSEEEQGVSRCGERAQGSNSQLPHGATGSQARVDGPSSALHNMEEMMTLMAQRNNMMAQCMDAVRNMRADLSHLSNRVAEVETSAQAMNNPPAMSSTPEASGYARDRASQGRETEPKRGAGKRGLHEEASRWKKVDLDKWHVK